jgi:hypothetical protein
MLRPGKATPEDKRKYKADGQLYANQRLEDETPEQFGARIRTAIAAEPERYYQRGTVVRLAAEEKDAAWDLYQTVRMIRESEKLDLWPRNPEACLRFGTCPYFDVCTGVQDIEDELFFRKVETKHEELTC